MKTKGFTLVEILVVVLLIAMLATVAIQSYVNSTTNFKFLAAYQQVTSALRTARSDALSNKQQNGISPKGYGVCIGTNGAITFADTGSKNMKFDLTTTANVNFMGAIAVTCPYTTNANGLPEDTILQDKSFNISKSGYVQYSLDPKAVLPNNIISGPVVLFYESGTGNFSAYDGSGNQLSKSTMPYFSIEFCQNVGGTCVANGLLKYIHVYQVSGLVEEATTLK